MLEKEFGGNLFDRKRSSIELTDLGKLVRPYLEEVWRTAFAAKRLAREYTAKVPKELNLAVMCTIAPKLLVQMLCRFPARKFRYSWRMEKRGCLKKSCLVSVSTPPYIADPTENRIQG
jgi:DNA-binding transcriptional LysR family regulator